MVGLEVIILDTLNTSIILLCKFFKSSYLAMLACSFLIELSSKWLVTRIDIKQGCHGQGKKSGK